MNVVWIFAFLLIKQSLGLADENNTFSVGSCIPTEFNATSSVNQPHYLVTNTEFTSEAFVVGYQSYCTLGGSATISV